MNAIGLVTTAGIKSTLRMKVPLMIMIPILIICAVGVALLLCLLLIAPEMKSSVPDRALLEGYLGLALYASALLAIGIMLNSFIFQMMIREKTRGNLAALLATPLRVGDIWVGKSLTLFVPGLVLAVIMTVLTWVIINVVYFVSEIGWVANVQMFVNSLVAVPLMYLFFGLLVHLIGYTARPANANVIAQVFLPLMANLAAQLVARGAMDANSWQFMALNFGLVVVAGVVVLILRPRLTPERVILSG